MVLPESGDYEDVVLVAPGWGGTPFKPISQIQNVNIMKHHPDSAMIFLSNPGVDKSDPLPKSVTKDKSKTGSFKSEGEYWLEGLDPVLEDLQSRGDKVSIKGRGHSEGALRGLGLAAAGLEMQDMVGIDPPGSERGYLKLVKNFVIDASSNAGKAAAALADKSPIVDKWQKYNDSLMLGEIKAQLKDPKRFLYHWVKAPYAAMSRGALELNLNEALEGGLANGRLRLIIPSYSELNAYPVVADIMTRVAQNHPGAKLEASTFDGVHFSVNDPALLGEFYK